MNINLDKLSTIYIVMVEDIVDKATWIASDGYLTREEAQNLADELNSKTSKYKSYYVDTVLINSESLAYTLMGWKK